MNALLKKLTVVCLVLALAGASWAGCCKGKSAGNGDGQKACESKEKNGNGDCEKNQDKQCDKNQDQSCKDAA